MSYVQTPRKADRRKARAIRRVEAGLVATTDISVNAIQQCDKEAQTKSCGLGYFPQE